MNRNRGEARRLTPAQRGAVVQRVLVDGWSVGETAAAFRLAERRVAAWVAAYRRHGMASLHDSAAIERLPGRWLWLLRITAARLAARLRSRLTGRPAPTRRRPQHDGPSSRDSSQRSRRP
jgi:Helix-turn-helix domain